MKKRRECISNHKDFILKKSEINLYDTSICMWRKVYCDNLYLWLDYFSGELKWMDYDYLIKICNKQEPRAYSILSPIHYLYYNKNKVVSVKDLEKLPYSVDDPDFLKHYILKHNEK